MPVVVEIEESVVDIARLASVLVVEIVLPASELAVEKPVADKAFVAGNWEVVDNLVGRLGNSVVEIADQAASHFLATVAGNEHVNQVAVNSDHTVELEAATESMVHRLAAVAFVVFVGAATAEAAFLAAAAVVAALVAAASVEALLVSTLAAADVDAIDAAADAAFAALALVAAASVEAASTVVASAAAAYIDSVALPLQAFDTAVALVVSATQLESAAEPWSAHQKLASADDNEFARQFVELVAPVAVHLVSASSAVAELKVLDLSATVKELAWRD